MVSKRNSHLFILLFLGSLSAFGPIVTDLYLPALPALEKVFGTSVSMVQLSLTVSLIGLASGQLLIGPISDKYGRKIPLLTTLVLFILSTLGCIYAESMQEFIVFRLIQGFMGAGGIVVSKSVAVDLFNKNELADFLSALTVINGLAPIIAPVAGGVLLEYGDWKGIFVTLLIFGLLILAATLFFKESLTKEKRLKVSAFKSFKTYAHVFRNKKFLKFTFLIGLSMGSFFCYLSASPFIFQSHYATSPLVYGLFFALNAIALIIGSRISIRFKSPTHAVKFASSFIVITSVIVAVLLALEAPVYLVELMFFLLMFGNGMILPTGTTLALNLERENAGSASALLGFVQFIFGGIVSPLVGIGNVMHTTGIIIVVCCISAWGIMRKLVKEA